MVYDSQRGVVVLTAADGADPLRTWELEGGVWRLRCGEGTACGGPPSGQDHVMVYDGARGVSVLFGGRTTDGLDVHGDTWEWDGTR